MTPVLNSAPSNETIPLHPHLIPAKAKGWGCSSCRLFQYAPCFNKTCRETYTATLDPERRDKKNNKHKIEGSGAEKCRVMAILDAPTGGEDNARDPWKGGSSYLIERNAESAGIVLDDWYFTFASKCHDPDERTSMKSAIYCTTHLSKEILEHKPDIIVTFGPIALQLMIGRTDAVISQHRGVITAITVAGHPCKLFPMQSPRYVQRNDYLMDQYLSDFDKLRNFLTGETDVLRDGSVYKIIKTPDKAIAVCDKMIEAIKKGKSVDADLETSGLNPFKIGARISVVSLSCNVNAGHAIMYDHNDCPWSKEDRERVRLKFKEMFQWQGSYWRWHNGKFDVKWVRKHFGFWPRDSMEDTMLAHYAVDENELHGLKPLALQFTDMGDYDAELEDVLAQQDYEDKPRYDLVAADLIGRYAAADSVATRKLSKPFKKMAKKQGHMVEVLSYTVLPALSSMLTRLEYAGCAIDVEYAKTIAKPYLEKQAKDSFDAILSQPVVRRFIRDGEQKERNKRKNPNKLPPIEVKQYFQFSLNSPNQLKELIYGQEYYAHEAKVWSDSGAPSTDKEAMAELIKENSPIAKAINEYRLDEKLLGSYLNPILAKCTEQGDNLLHPSLLLHGTKTGRGSCLRGDQTVETVTGKMTVPEIMARRTRGQDVYVYTHNGNVCRVSNAYSTGMNRVCRVKTGSGTSLVCTLDHVVYTPEGWRTAAECAEGTLSGYAGVYRCERLPEGISDTYPLGEGADLNSPGRRDPYLVGNSLMALSCVLSVEAVGDADVCETFDLTVEGDASYISNGFICHNCKDPNLQATPGKGGGLIKRLFVSRYGADGCIIQADFSQLELRIMAAASGDPKMIKAYAEGKDLHMLTCCLIYDMTEDDYNKLDKLEQKNRRVMAKRLNFGLCVDQHTPVMTDSGFKAIRDVTLSDRLWDGEAWVSHEGAVCTGVKETINRGGIWLTPDHEMLTDSGWVKAQDLNGFSHYLTHARTTDGRVIITDEPPCNCLDPISLNGGRGIGPVYDIVNAGPHHRFQAGNHIVHNCYGIGAPGIAGLLALDGIIITEEDAQRYLDKFFEAYPRVGKWLDSIHSGIESDEYSLSLFSRRRRLEQVRSSVNEVKARALRQGANHVVQSTGADMTWTSMLLMDREIMTRAGYPRDLFLPTLPKLSRSEYPIDKRWRKMHQILQVHDSILIDAPLDIAAEGVDMVARTMPKIIERAGEVWGQEVYDKLKVMTKVPVLADIEVGPSWRDAYKVKSGKDVPLAMHVANTRMKVFDKDSRFEWTGDHDKSAIAEFEALTKKAASK